ncbi:MAG: DUF2793 domain-containing protein [Pseudomonadota bacterium]
MASTHHLALPYLAAGQATKHLTHNEALKALDTIVQLAVESRTTASPPASPTEGSRYIVPGGAADAFAGQDGQLAAFSDASWAFHAPKVGWLAWVADETQAVIFDGTTWVGITPALLDQLGIGTSADTTNRLAVASDAVLMTAATADMQLKFNKASTADTATLLFQSGWTGKAEVGLAGNDDLSFKVEAGGAWATALAADGATGNVAIGHASPSCALDVAGPVRVGQYTVATLPSASASGAGAIAHVSDKNGSPALAVSDGSVWLFTALTA